MENCNQMPSYNTEWSRSPRSGINIIKDYRGLKCSNKKFKIHYFQTEYDLIQSIKDDNTHGSLSHSWLLWFTFWGKEEHSFQLDVSMVNGLIVKAIQHSWNLIHRFENEMAFVEISMTVSNSRYENKRTKFF